MSREMTDTTNKFGSELPDGRNLFKVESVVKKYGKNNSEFFIWRLQFDKGTGEQVLLPNMMGELLRVLKCDETEPNKFDWDTFEQAGKIFLATVSRKPDSKNPAVIRQHMGEFSEYKDGDIPF